MAKTKSDKPKTCKHCGAEKMEGDNHRHCGECGALLRKGRTMHKPDCPRLDLPQWAWCPKCKRLLGAGAWCPEHGDPMKGKAA